MGARWLRLSSILAFAASFGPLTATGFAQDKRATPPSAKDLVGIWIGFDSDQLTFTRLDLRPDSTGFCARVSPADTILHDQGVHVYRVTKWSVSGWNIEIQMSPVSNATAVGYVKGRIGLASLKLTIGGPENGGWKEEPFLYPESRITTSDRETREEIERAANNGQGYSPQPAGPDTAIAGTAPSDWQKVDAGPFSILAPSGWEFNQLPGVDTFVGEFAGNGFALKFDFGRYAKGCFKGYKKPTYVIAKRSIGGLSAKIVTPRAPSHGITGVYFREVSGHGALCLWGKDLTAAQQEFALKIFETIRFGGPMPKYLLPPPPPPPKNER